jgi:UDP-N-acetylmuramoylalanine--D-glutamate ligase
MSRAGLQPGTSVLVAGGGITGRSVLAALAPLGVTATLCDDDPATRRQFADAGTATVDSSTAAQRIADYALVVTSPGFPPTAPVPAAAQAAGIPIWGDVELAWRLDAAGHYGPPRRWLAVTGTNGKTTTTSMLQAMLTAAGLRSKLCGNIGSPCSRCCVSPPTCWPWSCPASSCTGRRRCGPKPVWCSTSPKTIWTGMAASPSTRPTRRGC